MTVEMRARLAVAALFLLGPVLLGLVMWAVGELIVVR